MKTRLLCLALVTLLCCGCAAGKTGESGVPSDSKQYQIPSVQPAAATQAEPEQSPAEAEQPASTELPSGENGQQVPEQLPETQPEPQPTAETPEPAEQETPSRPECCWYDAVSEELSWSIDEGAEQVSVHIPAFSEECAGAAAMNARIEADTEPFLSDILDAQENRYSPGCSSILYEAYLNGDVASVLVDVEMSNDIHFYYAYNLNIMSGEILDGDAVLALYGCDEDSFVMAARGVVSDYFREIYGELMDDEFVLEQYEKTMSADGYGSFLPVFLGEEGTLGFVVPVYAVAGADSYETVFFLNG